MRMRIMMIDTHLHIQFRCCFGDRSGDGGGGCSFPNLVVASLPHSLLLIINYNYLFINYLFIY